VQLWVAQPDATRHGPPRFEHAPEVPAVDLGVGGAVASVLVGELAGAVSPARVDAPLVGAEIRIPPGAVVVVPLEAGFEHAVIGLGGPLEIDGVVCAPGSIAYAAPGRSELRLRGGGGAGPEAVLLLGGVPFAETLLMWWNFVARERREMEQALADWESEAGSELGPEPGAGARFGPVRSGLERIPAPRPQWQGQPPAR
jgi:redox-sensitive bicupin YhaK (pirin superfamily)